MLDSCFNAKFGDFWQGLLITHGERVTTTALDVIMGYMAPECLMMGKGSMESNIYSFGILALEICWGRRHTSRRRPQKIRSC